MKPKNTLGEQERLKSKKQIDALFASGRKLMVPPFRVFYSILPSQASELRFGVGVSSKIFRKAVDRNRVKRLIRECWRLQKHALRQYCVEKGFSAQVFVVYTGKDTGNFEELFRRTGKIISMLMEALEKK